MEQSSGAMVFSALYYTSLFVFIIFLILVFVHFMITPIFALTGDDPGIFVISGSSDRELYYTGTDDKATPGRMRMTDTVDPNKKKPTTLPSCSYTMGVDIYVSKDRAGPSTYEYDIPLLYRSSKRNSNGLQSPPVPLPTSGTAFKNLYTETNVILSLSRDLEEIHLIRISASKSDNVKEEVKTKNGIKTSGSTIQKNSGGWFRVTFVLGPTFAELYLNGEYVETIIVPSLLQITENDFWPPPVINTGIQIKNVSMWPRILTPNEIRRYEKEPL